MSNKGGESWWIDLHGTCELEQAFGKKAGSVVN
jgi:hypothetical protein